MFDKEIFKKYIQNVETIKNLVFTCKHLKYRTIELLTSDEGLCSAQFFIVPKSKCHSSYDAIILLLTLTNYYFEQWKVSDMDEAEADNFIKKILLEEIANYSFDEINPDKMLENIQPIIELIIHHIQKTEDKNVQNNNCILDNSKRCKTSEIQMPLSYNINSCLILKIVWNEIVVLYRTKNDYVLFTWGTGA